MIKEGQYISAYIIIMSAKFLPRSLIIGTSQITRILREKKCKDVKLNMKS